MRFMVDALNPLNIPVSLNPQLVATYIDHSDFPDSLAVARTRFPNAVIVSISAHNHPAQVLDVENGAATVADVPGWIKSGPLSRTVYATASNWQKIVAICWQQHVSLPMWWEALWNNEANLLPDRIGHQYTDNPPANPYDSSVVADYWPTVDPAPTPPIPPITGDEMKGYISAYQNGEWLVHPLYEYRVHIVDDVQGLIDTGNYIVRTISDAQMAAIPVVTAVALPVGSAS